MAGALALNIVHNQTEAIVGGGGHVTVNGGAISIQATSTENDTAKAKSDAKAAVGVGASVALNILPQTHARAEVEDGAVFGGTGLTTLTVKPTARAPLIPRSKWFRGRRRCDAGGRAGAGPGRLFQGPHGERYPHSSGSGAISVEAYPHGRLYRYTAKAEAAGDKRAIGPRPCHRHHRRLVHDRRPGARRRQRRQRAGAGHSDVKSAPEAHASAKGGDSSDDTADKKADKQTSNNSNVSGAPTTNTSQNNGGDANSSSTGQSGGGGSSVGIAASASVDVLSLSNTAQIADNSPSTRPAWSR